VTKKIKAKGLLFTSAPELFEEGLSQLSAGIALDSWEKDTCANIQMACPFSQVIRTYDKATIILEQYIDAKTKTKYVAGACYHIL
jgi:hypothetical protein